MKSKTKNKDIKMKKNKKMIYSIHLILNHIKIASILMIHVMKILILQNY